MRFLPRLLSILVLISLLSGCIAYDSNHRVLYCFKVVPPETRQAMLEPLTHWDINGYFMVQFATPKGWSAVEPNTFTWNYGSLNSYDLTIYSNLLMYNLHFVNRYNFITLFKNNVYNRAGRYPEALMAQAVGWSLPIRNLRYWVRGIPAKGKFEASYDVFGLLRVLRQDGWVINYDGYTNVEAYDLPIKITLVGHGMLVHLIVKDWNMLLLHDSVNPAP